MKCADWRKIYMIETFFERKATELGVKLNDIQKQAVIHTDGPLLLLATPGSGKTTTTIMRIGYLIEEKQVHPRKIKAVTFSKAAAVDMRERFVTFFPELPLVDFSTIHSLAFEVVRHYFREQNIHYQFVEGNVGELHKHVILRNIYGEINNTAITADHLEELVSYISFLKNKLIPREKWYTVKCDVRKALEIVEQYEHFKAHGTDQLLIDYDDMLTIANTIFETEPAILTAYQVRYEYVLTDESQDTSLVQHAIMEKLVAEHQNICVVADDDQSIYTWRAAEPAYLLDFKKTYPNATILTMEQNYRSTEAVVTVANQFIKQNKQRYDKEMFTENTQGEQIHFGMLPDYHYQANYLVERVKNADKFADVAILYRNNLSSIVLADAFDRAEIPFYMKDGHNRFFEHWVVEDILNFMRLAYDDTRVTTLEKIFSKFNGYISKVQLKWLKAGKAGASVFDRLSTYNGLKDYQIKTILQCKKHFETIKTSTPPQIIELIRKELGYDETLRRMCERLGFNLTHLHEILHILEEIAVGTTTMEDFAKRLNYLKDLLKQASFNKVGNAVTLSTMHSAKGLEFKEVYLIDLIEGNLPAQADIDELDEGNMTAMEEAVRLFYVGMTRAVSRLELVTYPRKLNAPVEVSRFYKWVRNYIHPEEAERALPKSTARAVKGRQTTTFNPNAIVNKTDLQVGLIVKHRVFGRGEIVRFMGDILYITFVKDTKEISASVCLERGILEVVR